MKTAAEWAKWMNENPMEIGSHAGTTDAYEAACQRAFERRIAMVQDDAKGDLLTAGKRLDAVIQKWRSSGLPDLREVIDAQAAMQKAIFDAEGR